MSAKNKALSRRWFNEVWNDRRDEAIAELLSPDGIGHMESGEVRGVDAFKQVRDGFLGAIPDLKFEIEGIVSDGDDVVVRWCAKGVHSGNGMGLEPTDHEVCVRGMTWHRYKNGVMVEGWDHWNQEAFLQKLREGSDAQRRTQLAKRREMADRIREIRAELFGKNGGPELARRLGLPIRTWYNYETGVTVPAEVLFRFIEETGANPVWLLSGKGSKYVKGASGSSPAVKEILREALAKLEQADAKDAAPDTQKPKAKMKPKPKVKLKPKPKPKGKSKSKARA